MRSEFYILKGFLIPRFKYAIQKKMMILVGPSGIEGDKIYGPQINVIKTWVITLFPLKLRWKNHFHCKNHLIGKTESHSLISLSLKARFINVKTVDKMNDESAKLKILINSVFSEISPDPKTTGYLFGGKKDFDLGI